MPPFLLLYVITICIVSTIHIMLAFHVLSRDVTSRLNRLFFMKFITITSAFLLLIPAQLSDDHNGALFFYKAYMILIAVYFFLCFYFYSDIIKRKTKKMTDIAMTISLLSIIILILFSGRHSLIIINADYFRKFIYSDIPMIFYAYSLVITVAVIVLLYKYYYKTDSVKEKKQILIMGIFIIISIFCSTVTDLILPHFDFYGLPSMTPFFFAIYIAAIFYVLVKYRFLSFNKRDIVQEIFSNVQDMIVILDPEKSIIEENDNFKRIFKNGRNLAGKNIEDLILIDTKLQTKFAGIIAGTIKSFNERIIYKTGNDFVSTESYISRIVDKFGDFVAILMVSKENQDIKNFKKVYDVTDRQLEIIQLSIDGLSNEEIGKRLGLARRTVESHLYNVYNKLSIKNKIELMKISKDFDLIENK